MGNDVPEVLVWNNQQYSVSTTQWCCVQQQLYTIFYLLSSDLMNRLQICTFISLVTV